MTELPDQAQQDRNQPLRRSETIAATIGIPIRADPFRPVLRGQLLTGMYPRYLRSEANGKRDAFSTKGPMVAPREDGRGPVPDAVPQTLGLAQN